MKDLKLKLKSVIEIGSLALLSFYDEVSLVTLIVFLLLRISKNIVFKKWHSLTKQPFVFTAVIFIVTKNYLLTHNSIVASGLNEVIIPYIIIPLLLALEGITFVVALQRWRRRRDGTS